MKQNSELWYKPFPPLSGGSLSKRLGDIQRLIHTEDYPKAISECRLLIRNALEGLRYYQTYDWYFVPNTSTSTGGESSDPWGGGVNYGSCIGDACCSPGLTYDTSINQCVPSTKETFITETNINKVLTQKQIGNYREAINLKQPEPFNNYR